MNYQRILAVARDVWLLAIVLGTLAKLPEAAGQTALFSTGFEVSEGYSTEPDLAGQEGWVGTAGNGVLTNFFPGLGQQAYIGFSRPVGDTNDFFTVYRPINLTPVPATQALITFSVRMQIVDTTSTNGPWDDFRWSVYNAGGQRLFSLDFDNASLMVSYLLDDGAGFVTTDTKFDTAGYYDLVISMNFARNLWSATLNDQTVVNAKPITTIGSPLTLGDIGAVWSLHTPSQSGDNYMLFDDYTITAAAVPSIPPRLESAGVNASGAYQASFFGEPGLVYTIEASTNLMNWQPVLTVTTPSNGMLEFRDPTASTFPIRFYRARQGE